MDAQLNGTIKYAVISGDGQTVNIDTHLVGNDLGNVKQHAYAVNTLDVDGSVKEKFLMHVPLGIKDAIAKASLKFSSHRTGTLMNLYLMATIDEAQHIVARNGVTAMLELILRDVVVCDEDGLFAVELLWHHK